MIFSIFGINHTTFQRAACGLTWIAAVWMGVAGITDFARAEPPALPKAAATTTTVVFVSEVPYQWNSEMGNPLELWARKLSSQITVPLEGTNDRVKNLTPVLSWEKLEKLARSTKDCLFAIHGYEYVESRNSAMLDALLVPSLNGKAAMTEFVILRRKDAGNNHGGRKFTMQDFEPGDGQPMMLVLVDRGGCGELVYRWLDCLIKPDTGVSSRENLADFRTAPSAHEAILAVYFGEANACVVSREAWNEAMRFNPRGLSAKLEEARTSPPLLRYVIACPSSMEKSRRAGLVKDGGGAHHVLGPDDWKMSPPKPEDFKTLEALQKDWASYFGSKQGKTGPEVNPEPVPPAALVLPAARDHVHPAPPSVSATRDAERRPLE